MSLSDWEAELRDLRADLGPIHRMKLRYRWTSSGDHASGLELLTGRGVRDTLVLALYPDNARQGERPTVEVEVVPNEDINTVAQGSAAEVAGRPEAGHAVVVMFNGTAYWPTYPCSLSVRAPRL